MACIYLLNGNKFNSEEELDKYIRENNLHESIGDFKFSRKEDLAKRNVEALTEMREKNSMRLKELGDSNKMKELLEDEEDTNMTFTDNHISVLDFVIDNISENKQKFNQADWESKIVEKLRRDYNKLPEKELNEKIQEELTKQRNRIEHIRKIGKGVHAVVYSALNKDIKSLGRNFVDIVRQQVRDYNSKNITIDNLSDDAIMNIAEQIHKLKFTLLKNTEKLFIEPCIDYSDENYDILGKIDIVVIHKDNTIDIVDIKASSKSYSDWDINKVENAENQLRTYEAMLEAKGITSNKVNLYILPIKLNLNNNIYDSATVHDLVQVNMNPSKEYKIHNKIRIDPVMKTINSDIVESTTEILSSMFGFDAYNYEIGDANFEYNYKNWVTKLPNGKYKFKDSLGKSEIIRDTEDEIKHELSKYLYELEKSRIKNVTRIYEKFVEISKITDISKRTDRTSRLFDFFYTSGKNDTSINNRYADRNIWMKKQLGKYQKDINWKIVENEDLLNLGVLMFKNDLTKEVDFISITYDTIDSKIPMKYGKYLVGNFYSDSMMESNDYKLEATIGNMELMKLIYLSNLLENDYTVGEMKVLSLSQMTDNNDYGIRREKLEKNYNILSKKVGKTGNKTQSTDPFIRIMNLYDSIKNKMTVDSYDDLAREISNLEVTKEVDKHKQLEQLINLESIIRSQYFVSSDPTEDQSIIGSFYIEVVKAIVDLQHLDIDYINEKALSNNLLGGNFVESFKRGTLGNSTQLNTSDTIPLISKITSTIFSGNSELRARMNAYKVVDRRHTDKFYSESGSLLANKITNTYEFAFKELFDDSEDGKRYYRLKDYRTDTSLNSKQKEYLKWWLEDLNKYRYPGRTVDEVGSEWFEVPLVRANFGSRILHGQSFWKATEDTIGIDIINPKMAMGMDIENTDYGKNVYMFESMYNGFKRSEDPEERMKLLKNNGIESYDTNLERIKDMYVAATTRKEIFDPIVRNIGYVLTAYAAASKMSKKMTANKDTIEFLSKFVRSSVLDESLVDEKSKDTFKVVGMLKSITSKSVLGLNLRSMAKEGLVGGASLYINALANNFSGSSDRFGAADAAKAYAMVWKDAVNQVSTITMGEFLNFEYGFANMSNQELVERLNYMKGELGRFDDRLFFTARAFDFLHRMTIFYAYMIKHGSLEAHKVVGDHVEYDWKKDKRFSLYASDRTGNSIPASMKTKWADQRALFEAMKRQMIKEKITYVDDWETGHTKVFSESDDFLPRAYTNIEAEKMIQESNTIYGYMDNENKSMFFKEGIGILIGQFKTFFSAKKNQWFLARGTYKNGSWKHITDEDGNKLYYTYDESGEKIMTTEVTDMPVIDWEGSMMEGIFWSLKDLFSSLLNIHTKEGRARLKELMKDPVKLRNYMLATGDLFGALLFYMIATLLWGGLKDSEKSYIEKNLEWLLLSSSNELNLWKVFNGQIDFQFTGYVTVSKMVSSFKNVITENTNVQRALADNLGALSIFKSAIYDTYPVDNG